MIAGASRDPRPRAALLAAAVLLASAALGSGCAGGPRPATAPRAPQVRLGHTETGFASWYGPDYHGNTTASGERYNMFDLTAAHQTLPFGTKVRVENLENRREVVVRINDRGPFKKRRIIDLSYRAARELGMSRNGTTKVRVEVVALPEGARASEEGSVEDLGEDPEGFVAVAEKSAVRIVDLDVRQRREAELLRDGGVPVRHVHLPERDVGPR